MKNIHILPTDKPSRLIKSKINDTIVLEPINVTNDTRFWEYLNIYITNDEEIKEGDWCLDIKRNIIFQSKRNEIGTSKKIPIIICTYEGCYIKKDCKKIILTTDGDLIKDGVQAIDDEFLEWFVKNPSCEVIFVNKIESFDFEIDKYVYNYKIIIPKEEPKQLFTDHPITELGDKEFVEAPIRECELISYDDNKYCYVKVEGIEKEIKRCYIYPQKGRYGDVDCVSIEEIKELLEEEPKQETIENIKLEQVLGSTLCKYTVIENKLATIYRNQEQILKAIKMLNKISI
jgi:hypothetical protein